MLSTKKVLPNFLKTILVAAMATSFTAYAGDHGHAEEAIGDLKDVVTDAVSEEAEAVEGEITDEVDLDALESSLTEDASAEAHDALDAAEEAAEEAAPE